MNSGAFFLFKEKFEEVNGFDEGFAEWGNEYDDLGSRLYLT
ncbi:MAG: galactosyltransferase-related protein [Gammaproteobacteria bacterium]